MIAATKEAAIDLYHQRWKEIKSSPSDWTVVYSDGSERDGHVGTAAKMMHPEQDQIGFYMGDSTISTIYTAELYGIGLALYLAMLYNPPSQKTVIFTDN